MDWWKYAQSERDIQTYCATANATFVLVYKYYVYNEHTFAFPNIILPRSGGSVVNVSDS